MNGESQEGRYVLPGVGINEVKCHAFDVIDPELETLSLVPVDS